MFSRTPWRRGAAVRTVAAFYPERLDAKVLHPAQASRRPLESGVTDGIFAADGRLGQIAVGYEERSQQLDMVHRVTAALNDGRHIMLEAGTGIGKSLAYLLPAALWATQNDQRVVVSTQTINLQDQLLKNDIPTVKQALDGELRAAVMKGPRQLSVSAPPGNPALAETGQSGRTAHLAKILVWMQGDISGDKGGITLRAGEEAGLDTVERRG